MYHTLSKMSKISIKHSVGRFCVRSILWCNECRPIRVVVLMVMLTGYLPKNAKRAFYNADLVDLHRRSFIRISRQIA